MFSYGFALGLDLWLVVERGRRAKRAAAKESARSRHVNASGGRGVKRTKRARGVRERVRQARRGGACASTLRCRTDSANEIAPGGPVSRAKPSTGRAVGARQSRDFEKRNGMKWPGW